MARPSYLLDIALPNFYKTHIVGGESPIKERTEVLDFDLYIKAMI